MAFVILTGASGAGKTTIAEAIEARCAGEIDVFVSDRSGVPPEEQMVAEFGSAEEWQRQKTIGWMARIAPLLQNGRPVLLDGQMRIAFVQEAAAKAGIAKYKLILVDCNDAVRIERLISRRQPELANPTMMNWARYLRQEALISGIDILETSGQSVEESVRELCQYLCLSV